MSVKWAVAGTSARGAAHIRTGKLNQDCAGWIGPKHGEAVITAVVSDGHGAPEHNLSHIGSALAISVALDEAAKLSMSDDGLPPARLKDADGLIRRIHGRWAVEIGKQSAVEETPEITMRRHGATLVGAHLSGDRICLFRVGDGDILLVRASGKVERPLPEDEGLTGEETRSLCEADAPNHGHVAVVKVDGRDPVVLVMLSTDGVGKSFADERGLDDVARGFSRAAANGQFADVASRLGEWASDLSARGSGDDASLALIASIGEHVFTSPVPKVGSAARSVRAASSTALAVSTAIGVVIGVAVALVAPRLVEALYPEGIHSTPSNENGTGSGVAPDAQPVSSDSGMQQPVLKSAPSGQPHKD